MFSKRVHWEADDIRFDGIEQDTSTSNVFCPTGKGGGIDPTCRKGGAAGPRTSRKSKRAMKKESLRKQSLTKSKEGGSTTKSKTVETKSTKTGGKSTKKKATETHKGALGQSKEIPVIATSDLPTSSSSEAQFKDTVSLVSKLVKKQPEMTEAREHGMKKPEAMVALKFGDVKIKFTKDQAGYESAASAMLALSNMPPEVSKYAKTITSTSQSNRDDAHWEKAYGISGFKSAATGGENSTVLYRNHKASTYLLSHEVGHNIAHQTWGDSKPPKNSAFYKAWSAEPAVSKYGQQGGIAEDFAESVAFMSIKSERAKMKQHFPKKHKAIMDLLKLTDNTIHNHRRAHNGTHS